MSKKLILTVGALMMGAHLHGLLVAAFDFGGIPSVADNVIIEASHTDLSSDTNDTTQVVNDPFAGSFATLDTTGLNDSTAFNGTINTTENNTIASRIADNVLPENSSNLQNFGGTGGFFDIHIDVGGTRAIHNIEVTYAFNSPFNNTSGIQWTVIGDGFSQTIESTSSTFSTETLNAIFANEANAVTSLILRGTLTGSGTSNIDNIQINATVVPEPSTYAAMAGVAVLGFVALRRRRK